MLSGPVMPPAVCMHLAVLALWLGSLFTERVRLQTCRVVYKRAIGPKFSRCPIQDRHIASVLRRVGFGGGRNTRSSSAGGGRHV